ncbi:MAG: SigE family RNA polymerase sigma factor [Acidimicrobiales bacterium]
MTLSDHPPLVEASVRVSRLEPYANTFDAFVRESSAALARLAFLLTGDRQLGEDLLQTALSKVLPHWHRVVATGDPTPYVRTVMVRTAIGWRRRRWNGETPAQDLPEPTAAADFSSALDTRERLRVALTTLPARQRAVVVLRFYEDRSEAEVADLLGCSVGTVKSQAAKALAKLRARLDDELSIPQSEGKAP